MLAVPFQLYIRYDFNDILIHLKLQIITTRTLKGQKISGDSEHNKLSLFFSLTHFRPKGRNRGKKLFSNFSCMFVNPNFFPNLNSNCSNLLNMRNLQEPVKKAICTNDLWKFQKFFSITRTIYSNSERSDQFLVTECFFNFFLEVSHI